MPRLTKKTTAWFDVPNDPDNARMEIVHLLPGEEDDLGEEMKEFRRVLRRGPDGYMEQELVANERVGDKRYLFIVRSVVAWEGVLDSEGKPIPCTDANKIKLARDWRGFDPFVNECRVKLAEQISAEKEQALGNSGSTSGGSSSVQTAITAD